MPEKKERKKGDNASLYRWLTKLFRSNPTVRRKVRSVDTTVAVADRTRSNGYALFQRTQTPTYSALPSSGYDMAQRLTRYQEYQDMETMPEISSALDIWADESCAQSDKGRILHIFSENERIKEVLEDLFYNVVNTEFNLRPWTRNLPVRRGTLIPLLDGRNIPIEQVVAEVSDCREVWVYSIQDGTQKIVPGRVVWGGLTERNSVIARVHLDDGSYVDVSPEHEFVLRDGRSKRADELECDDSLMPFYRHLSVASKDGLEGYERVYDPNIDAHEFTHRIVAKHACVNKGEIEGSKVIHHINFCKLNNAPSNLREMTWYDHARLHADHCKDVLHTPETTAKRMVGIDRWLRSDKHRHQAREQLKWMQAQGLMATSWSEYNNSDLHRQHNEIRRIAQRNDWADPRRREIRIQNLSIHFDDACIDMIVEQLRKNGAYVGMKRLAHLLKLNDRFMMHFRAINSHTVRDITKALNTREGLAALLRKTSWPDYWQLIETRLPEIASTPVFKKYRDRSFALRNRPTAMNSSRRNHKVIRVEFLNEHDDVYCIDVRGPNGEHDRHNFMLLGMDHNGHPTLDSGVCVSNCKYGDLFLFLDVVAGSGVQNVVPIPVNEIEREENFDPSNPFAVRYKFTTRNRYLEDWEIAHMRLLGNDMFLPYGTSVIEGARRIWRQLILAEDAMLVYRVTRAPDRRVFYLDVGNMSPDEIKHYVEEQKQLLRNSSIIDQATGRVDLRYNSLCLSLKTLIKLQDGRVLPLSSLIDEWNSGKCEQYAYSIDLENKRIVPGKIVWAGITRRNSELVRVTLDSGTWHDVTPDHRFMLRDGTYMQAKDLMPGQSLMPLYVKKTRKEDGHRIEGYEKMYDPFSDEWVLTHRNNAIVTQGHRAVLGKVVHHIDFDKTNNDPTNLQCMTWQEHCEYHGKHSAELSRMPASRERSRRTMKQTWQSGNLNPSLFVDLWKDPNVRHARVSALTLKFEPTFFIQRCFAVLDSFGAQRRVKESEFIEALNNDSKLKQHIVVMNPQFKNGFIGKFTRGGLQSKLKKLGFQKSLMSLQQCWLLQRYSLDEIKHFCLSRSNCRRKDVLSRFKLSRFALEDIIRLSGESVQEFRARYTPGNARYQKKILNHKVVSVEWLPHREDTGCLTVEGVHNFAIGPSIDCIENFDLQSAQALESIKDYIIVHNSVDEDFFIPRRNKDNGTEVQTLAGGKNIEAIEDVAYLQKKVFSALKVPKAYLNFDENLSCLVGSTKIALLDGTSATIADLAARDWSAADHDVWVHACDPNGGSIVPGRVKRAWLTKNVDRVYRVHLDSGNTIECTENHPFLCRDGVYRRADTLAVGQSLMPLYRRLSRSEKNGGDDLIDGYEMSLNNASGEWEYTHKVVYHQKCSGNYTVQKQRVIHHVNIDKRDNRPSNLMEMDWNSHRAFHRANLETTLLRPDVVEKRKIEQLKWVKSDEHREFKRSFMKQHLRDNPDHPFLQNCSSERATERMLKIWSRPDYRALKSRQSKERWNDPAYRGKYMGDNNCSRRKNLAYDLEWLRQFCADHDVTSINQWRGDYRDSVKGICPFGSGHVRHLLAKHGFSNWKEFKSTIPYRDAALYTQKFVNRNHKIVSIEIVQLDEPIAVYDLEVEKWHNFAVAGDGCQDEFDGFVFVHNSKASAAQSDIRFSRSVAIIQKTVIAELNKIAAVHLAALGYRGDDLINFTLRLSNPSTIAQQQKLELWRTRLEIASSTPEGIVSRGFIRREIFELTEQQSKDIDDERFAEKTIDATIEDVAVSSGGEGAGDEEGAGKSAGGLTPPVSADEEGGTEGEEAPKEEPEQQNASVEPEEEGSDLELLTSGDDPALPARKLSIDRDDLPVNIAKHVDRALYNRSRIRHHGASKTHMPDMSRMTGIDTPEMSDPYDGRFLRSIATNPFGEGASSFKPRLGPDLEFALAGMLKVHDVGTTGLLSENASENEIFTLVEDGEEER